MLSHLIFLLLFLWITSGVQERTITDSIYFEMTSEEVIGKLEPSQKIVSRDGSEIVTEGFDSEWGSERRNTYVFHKGKLVGHVNVPVRKNKD